MAAALASLLVIASAAQADPCPGRTTPEINACVAKELDAAEAELERYLATARQRVSDDRPELRERIDAAQKAWQLYVDAECEAVYADWQDGTIRTVMDLTCRIGLTHERTHAVWRHWLTYMDNSPPILPEPVRD